MRDLKRTLDGRQLLITDDDATYDNYVPTTIDPGDTLLYVAIGFCFLSLAGVPVYARIGRVVQRKLKLVENSDSANTPWWTRVCLFRKRRRRRGGVEVVDRAGVIQRGLSREARESVIRHQKAHVLAFRDGVEISYHQNDRTMDIQEQQESFGQNNLAVSHANEMVESTASYAKSVVRYDYETMRLLRLAVPFCITEIVDSAAELITLALISNYIGTDEMIAYVMVSVFVGVSSEFVGGFCEVISSKCSHAFGARNHELAGQYVQISMLAFIIGQVPCALIWGFSIGPILQAFGFSDTQAEIASSWVWIAVCLDTAEGIDDSYGDFLEVIGHEAYSNAIGWVSTTIEIGLVAFLVIFMGSSLTQVGLLMLCSQFFWIAVDVIVSLQLGWIRKHEVGLFGKFALRNRPAVKETVKTALPLAFGNLFENSEWEILTLFAVALGPAEATTWAVLGFLWDVLESATEAMGDAGEVRCAYQLGKGRPALAKLVAFKCLFLDSILVVVVTTVFVALSGMFPSWLTRDETIQKMLSDLIPLVALGNIAMSLGMATWALIGSQGRYHLSTSISLLTSFFITIPLGAVMTLWLNIDLQGLTFSIIVGDAATASLLFTVFLISDWEHLSKKVIARVAAEEQLEEDSDDSSSCSSCASGEVTMPNKRRHQVNVVI